MPSELKHDMRLTWTDSGGSLVTCDFGRFRYLHVPQKAVIQGGEISHRDGGYEFAQSLYDLFQQEGWTDATKVTSYRAFVSYVAYCDKAGLDPCSEEGLNSWHDHIVHEHMLGKLKDGSCKKSIFFVKDVLLKLDFPAEDWLDTQGEFGNTQTVHVQVYSTSDLKKLLSLLTKMFHQLYDQFIARPEYYIRTYKLCRCHEKYAMRFTWKKETFTAYTPISKLACLSAYILAYYTWGNMSQLFQLKRPDFSRLAIGEKWAEMTVYKPRSHKYITLEIGENDSLHLGNHGVKLFEKICNISSQLNPAPNARLLNWIQGDKAVPLTYRILWSFNKWLKKTFHLRDDFDRPLQPRVQRFRASGIMRFQARTGSSLAPAIISEDTPRVLDGNYSTGNKFENDLQIQACCHTLEFAARRRQGVPDAKQATKDLMKVEVLPYEAFLNQVARPGRNVNDSHCRAPHGDGATEQNRKEIERKALKEGERIACADMLEYFNCPDQGTVESLEELWRILSFRQCLEESAYLHLPQDQFENNFGILLRCIDNRLAQVKDQRMLQRAKLKLIDEGRHPQWLDSGSIRITVEKADEK